MIIELFRNYQVNLIQIGHLERKNKKVASTFKNHPWLSLYRKIQQIFL